MATLDEDWSKAVAEEVQREEDASDANVDAFHESDKSQILDKASRGRSLVATPRDPEVVVNAEASPAVVPSQPAAPLAPLAPTASTPAAMDPRPPPEEEEVHGDASAAYRDAVRDRAAHDEVPRADGQFGGYTSDDLDAVIALHPRDAIAASWALSDRLSVKSALRRRDRETSRS